MTGCVRGEVLAELRDPAVVPEGLLDRFRTCGRRSQPRARPGTRKLVCRARSWRSFQDSSASARKICRSGQYVTRVPVTPLATRPTLRSGPPGVNGAVGPGPANTPGTPRRNDIA